ncbi:MAG: succinate dehydrogenase cytochrome b subunit [Bacteroidia bacterium]|nr:succinate dehydrogenase cytochrome b subunit [Bacteroidia bacterium]
MSSAATVFSQSIGRKVVMGLSGLFLVSFLFVHVGGNLLLFAPLFGGSADGATFNAFVRFMTTNPLVKVLEYGLAFGFLIHIIYGLVITFKNNQARPVKYAFNKGKDKGSTWFSRNMIWTGIIVLIYLVVHVPMFWGKYHFAHEGNMSMTIQQAYEENVKVKSDIKNPEGEVVFEKGHYLFNKDFAMLQAEKVDVEKTKVNVLSMTELTRKAFEDPLVAFFYAASMLFLAFHLTHGFQSGFRTLGLVHKKYMPLIKVAGYFISAVIPFLFALMPLAFFFGLV